MYPQGLDQMFLAPMSGDLFMEQFKNASTNDQVNQQKVRQDMQFAAQKQPLTLEEMMLKNKTAQAQLPGIEANSTLQQHKAGISAHTLDQQKKAEMSKLFAQMSEDDWKQAENTLRQAEISQNPQERANARMLRQNMAEYQMQMLKEKEAGKRNNADNATRLKVAEIGAEASRYGADKRQAAGRTGTEIAGKMGFEKAAVYFEMKAMEETDPAEKQYYLQMADQMKKAYERARILSAQATQGGRVDAASTAGLPSMPTPQPEGMARPTAPTAPSSAPAAGRIRVMSPDGKSGTIPAAQLQEAMAAGYKEIK